LAKGAACFFNLQLSIGHPQLKGIGKGTIAKKLNATKGIWTPPETKRKKIGSHGWQESYIQKILQNRAVIGEYQPYKISCETFKREPVGEPITNYFPVIVSLGVFHKVQEKFKENKGKGGQTGKVRNLFKNLIKCPYCGGSVVYYGKGKPPKGGSYLICDNARRGSGCERHSIRYEECEKIILENCKGLRPEEVLPNPDEQTKLCQSLRQTTQGKEAELRDIEQQIENYDDQIGHTKDRGRRNKYESIILKLEEQKKDLIKQVEEGERELRKAESSLQSFTKWQKDLTSLLKGISGDNVELRLRLQYHLRELIEKIEVFAVGFKELYAPYKDDGICSGQIIANKELIKKVKASKVAFRVLKESDGDIKKIIIKSPGYSDNTETIQDYLYDVIDEGEPKFARSKEFHKFLSYVATRRMSKEGRFLRIYFKAGGWVDLVPQGSIASGSQMHINEDGKKSWKFLQPAIDKLWKEYKVEHKY